ncbi:3-hydroxyacyl-ACP dehydratase FabZ [Microlunatus lacustris]
MSLTVERPAPVAPPVRTPVSLSVEQIARLLPHRHPFALLDRVTDVVPGESAEAIKNISISDGLLAGHFPGRAIYPGVLLVECVAQLAAVVYGTEAAQQADDPDVADRVGYLAEIKQAKFLGLVTPGDQLLIKVRSGGRLGDLIAVNGQVSVDSTVVMTAKLTVTQHAAG